MAEGTGFNSFNVLDSSVDTKHAILRVLVCLGRLFGTKLSCSSGAECDGAAPTAIREQLESQVNNTMSITHTLTKVMRLKEVQK